MFRHSRLSIGFKITAGLLLFLFSLALATIWLVAGGFAQAEQTAVQRSVQSLQNQAEESLVSLTSLQAELYDTELQKAAHLTQIAADYVVNAHQTENTIDWAQSDHHVIWSGAQLTRSPDGLLYYDAHPARQTEILHPGNIPPDALTDQSLAETAVLDQLFPALLPQVENAVGIYYQGTQLTFRYYPVRNLPQLELENGAAAAAQTMHIEEFPVAPTNNPARSTIWLPPYQDDAGQGLLVSANTPIYFGDDFQGYIGIDVSLKRLVAELNSLKPTPGSFAFLIDADGQLIAAPPGVAVLGGEVGMETAVPALSPILDQGENASSDQIDLGGQPMLVTYAPLPQMGWRLLIVAPLSEVTAQSQAVSQSIRSDGLTTVRNTLLAMTAFFLIATLASVTLSYRAINRPLHRLLGGVRAVTSGDLAVSVPVTSQDELGELAISFNQMTGELNRRTHELTQTSSELAVKDTQLKVAALEERQRLARELHDSVSQALYGIALGARTARTLLDRDPQKVAEPLDYVLSLAEAGLSEMRALIFELRPESLQNEGVVAALTQTSSELAVKDTQLKVAALEERQRLARELHDSVSQALYGIALGARTARTLLDRDPQKVAEPLDYVLSLAEAGLSEMRALIFELRPESLQNEGLVAALTKQAAALQARHKLAVATHFCPEPDISLDAKEVLYRVAQEALHNTAKHASASRVELEMQCTNDEVQLTICDNGKGFNPVGDFPGHLGLQSMRERVASLHGDLQIFSQPGQGTTITVHLPA